MGSSGLEIQLTQESSPPLSLWEGWQGRGKLSRGSSGLELQLTQKSRSPLLRIQSCQRFSKPGVGPYMALAALPVARDCVNI